MPKYTAQRHDHLPASRGHKTNIKPQGLSFTYTTADFKTKLDKSH